MTFKPLPPQKDIEILRPLWSVLRQFLLLSYIQSWAKYHVDYSFTKCKASWKKKQLDNSTSSRPSDTRLQFLINGRSYHMNNVSWGFSWNVCLSVGVSKFVMLRTYWHYSVAYFDCTSPIRSDVAQNFQQGRGSYLLRRRVSYLCIYTTRISPTPNKSSVIYRFERGDAIEICNGIMLDFHVH